MSMEQPKSQQYGLTDERQSDGSRKAVDHTYEYEGEEITVKLLPPTISEIEEYEKLDDDVDASQLRSVIDKHIVEPDQEDYTMREVFAYAQGILDYAHGGSQLAEAARAELDKREGAEGN